MHVRCKIHELPVAYSIRGGTGISKVVRPLRIKDHSCMWKGGGGLLQDVECGMRHIASSYTSYTHVYLATRGCQCSMVGPRRAPDSPAKDRNDYKKHIHAGERRASVGHLAQSSGPQTVSAVWERDLRPAEKWSGLGRTSRTGDATSEYVNFPPLIASSIIIVAIQMAKASS